MDDRRDSSTPCIASAPERGLREAADVALRTGRLDQAAALYERVLEADPDDAEALFRLGVLHHRRGELDRAMEPLTRAVAIAPDHVMARTTLGIVLVALNRPAEALAHCREAARLRPGEAVFHSNLANVLRLLRHFDQARAAYAEAIRLDPNLAIAHAHLGLVLVEQNDIDGARRAFARAVELDPTRARFWEYLADLHGLVDQHDAAIPCWERVLALSPSPRARPHVALGWALQEEHRGDEAEAHFRTAASIDPHDPQPWINLGYLHEERGRAKEAEQALRTAIALDPQSDAAHARLASLLRDRLPAADLAALDARIADPHAQGKRRTRLLFARAQVADSVGDFALAARCAREANALQDELTPAYARFRPAEHDRYIDRIVRAFDAAFFARIAGAGLTTQRPVFIVGLPRTGTTLLEQVLASHPGVQGLGELRLACRMLAMPGHALGPSATLDDCVAQLDRVSVRRLAVAYERQIRAMAGAGSTAERLIDKQPDNIVYLGFLLALFPRATVIHCRRDPRDVALSCWMTAFEGIAWSNRPEHIAAKFRAVARVVEHWRTVLPATIHDVHYEELVSDIEGVSRRALATMGLDWDPACLEFHRNARTVRTASVNQVRRPLYTRSVARWRNYESELADLFAALPQN